jgi:NAD(P)-dependent dehydrogenase (short-subunit alcohol dehydrogenase family)
MTLHGKVALVTGGSRGLGLEITRALAKAGADVIVASRRLGSCESVAAAIGAEFGRRALPAQCNVSDWEQCDQLLDCAYDAFGRIDILVNNAGMSPLYASLEAISENLFDKVVGVNLKGPFRLAARAGSQMVRDGGGTILNISSIEAVRASPHALPYAAAKAGLNALTEGMAHAFAPSVRVNAIQCGAFLTDISESWPQAFRDNITAQTALRRAGRAAEIVGAALYLVGEQSSYCTGAILRLDGGHR